MITPAPTIQLEGTKFYIDISLEQFQQVDNPHNTIPFAELIEEHNYYLLFYDTKTKNVFEGMAVLSQPENLKIISIPLLRQFDFWEAENLSSHFASH